MPASTAASTPATPTFLESLFGKSKPNKPTNATQTAPVATGGRRRNKMRSMSRKNVKTRKNRKVRKSHSRRH